MTIEKWRNSPKLPKTRLKDIVLKHGSHTDRSNGLCAMEVVAWLAGETHSDHPSCACPAVAAMMRQLNDSITDDALRTKLLRPLLPKLVGSAASREVTIKRGFIVADFAVRIVAPIALEAAGLKDEATKLRALSPIVDKKSADAAADAAARAADAAAYAAARAARAADAAARAARAADAAARAARAAYAAAYAADAAAYAARAADAAARAADAAAYAAARAADAAADAAAYAKVYELAVDCINRMLEVKS